MKGHTYNASVTYRRREYQFQYVVNDDVIIPKDQIKAVKKSIHRDILDDFGEYSEQIKSWDEDGSQIVQDLLINEARSNLVNRIPGMTPNLRALINSLINAVSNV